MVVCSLWVVGRRCVWFVGIGFLFGLFAGLLVMCLFWVVCGVGCLWVNLVGFADWLGWGLGISGGCFGLLGCDVWVGLLWGWWLVMVGLGLT